MPSHHFSAFVSVLQDRGGTSRGHSGRAAAGRRQWRLCRCLLWVFLQQRKIFSAEFLCKSEQNLEILLNSRWPKGFREPCPHACHWLILQAFPKMWGRGRKRKHWLSKPKQRLCHWVPSLGSGKSSGKWLFFLLSSFLKRCGKHDSVASCKLNTRSAAAAVIGSSNLIGSVR